MEQYLRLTKSEAKPHQSAWESQFSLQTFVCLSFVPVTLIGSQGVVSTLHLQRGQVQWWYCVYGVAGGDLRTLCVSTKCISSLRRAASHLGQSPQCTGRFLRVPACPVLASSTRVFVSPAMCPDETAPVSHLL